MGYRLTKLNPPCAPQSGTPRPHALSVVITEAGGRIVPTRLDLCVQLGHDRESSSKMCGRQPERAGKGLGIAVGTAIGIGIQTAVALRVGVG